MMNANLQTPEAVPYRLARAADALMFSKAEPSRVTYSRAKRATDIALAGLLLLLFLPFLVLIGLAIRLESKGPALYRQRRTGLWGRPFTIYKLRTMVQTEPGAAVSHATKDDPRVTRLGSFLRRQSLDELPQLINVLKGDMSIVGPRPHAIAHDDHYSAIIPAYAHRFRTKPGITGLAQVSGMRGEVRRIDGMASRVALDNAYIDQWSWKLDVRILVQSVPLLVWDPCAY